MISEDNKENVCLPCKVQTPLILEKPNSERTFVLCRMHPQRAHRSYVGWWMDILSSVSFGCTDYMCTCVGFSVVYRCICVWACRYDLLYSICIHVRMNIYMWTSWCRYTYTCMHICGDQRSVLSVFLSCLIFIYYVLIDWLCLYSPYFLFKTWSLTEPGRC